MYLPSSHVVSPVPDAIPAGGYGKCNHCDAGHKAVFRPETREWVHNWSNYVENSVNKMHFRTTLCVAKTKPRQA